MRTFLALFVLAGALGAQVQRIDPVPVFTTAGNTPPGAYSPVLAVPGARIKICTDNLCASPATTYTDFTGSVSCPSTAQVVLAGTSTCVSVTDQQGNWGFWTAFGSSPGTLYYTVTLPNGTLFGPFPVSSSYTTLGTYIAPGTGGTPIPGFDKLAQTINVADYGAIADNGITDNATHIQNAINYANSHFADGGSTVYMCGSYGIKSTLTVTRGVHLVGCSNTGAQLLAMPAGTWQSFNNNDGIDPVCNISGTHTCTEMIRMCFSIGNCSTESHYSSIEDMQINANNQVDAAINVHNQQEQSYLHDLTITQWASYGIITGGQNFFNDQLYLFAGASPPIAGIHVFFNAGSRISFDKVTVTGNGTTGTGVALSGCYDCTVNDVHVEQMVNGTWAYNNGMGRITNAYGNPTVANTVKLGTGTSDNTLYVLESVGGGNPGPQLTLCDLSAPTYGTATANCATGARVPDELLLFRFYNKAEGILVTDSGEFNTFNSLQITGNLQQVFGSVISFQNSGVQTDTIDLGNNTIVSGFGGGTLTGLHFTSTPHYGQVTSAKTAGTTFSVISGAIGQTCTITFPASVTGYRAVGTAQLTSATTPFIASNSTITLTNTGQGYSVAPNGLSAVLTNGTAACSGSIGLQNITLNGFDSGGSYIVGYAGNNASAGLFQSGVKSDGATNTAVATSGEILDERDGIIRFFSDTGLTPGVVYSPTLHLTIDENGTAFESVFFGSLPAAAAANNGHTLRVVGVTAGSNPCSSGSDVSDAVSNGTKWRCP